MMQTGLLMSFSLIKNTRILEAATLSYTTADPYLRINVIIKLNLKITQIFEEYNQRKIIKKFFF